MEQKDFDIHEILKGVPAGTKLYTKMCGNVELTYIALNKEFKGAILVKNKTGEYTFNKNGRFTEGGEVMLFPSYEMRDWSKFFKKGDVLANKDGDVHVIFEGFTDNAYTCFKGKHYLWKECDDPYSKEESELITSLFKKASYYEAQTYINTIEELLGGKLNRETLEIEKIQHEFKNGDIAFADYGNRQYVFIVSGKTDLSEGYNSFISLDLSSLTLSMGYKTNFFKKDLCKLRLATEEEKKQLFSALEKESKRWDSEKKQVVDLKPAFKIGKLYVFNEEDEDGMVTVIGKFIGKNESDGTLVFGKQYEIETEHFIANETFYLNISLHDELREATEKEAELFNEHYSIWEKKEKEAMAQPDFKPFDKVLVRNGGKCKWLPAFFVRDRGEDFAWRYKVLPIHNGRTSDFASCIPYEGHEDIAFTDYDIEDL